MFTAIKRFWDNIDFGLILPWFWLVLLVAICLGLGVFVVWWAPIVFLLVLFFFLLWIVGNTDFSK
jgi:hypothetical protein